MPADKLIDPAGPTTALIAIAIGAVVGLIIVVAFGLWFVSRVPVKKIKLAPVKRSQREEWIARIDAVVARHADSADEQARALHIELAAELRAILSERAGMDLSSWQPSQLSKVPALSKAAEAIGSWEEPSFAAYARADIPKARDRAVEAVLAW
ncbi:hypothetical protein [Trueperella bialowiezensis]|uniref:Uncharacterized protein n=1 Tax=Trueperella bialowiezensis TaxID=312285 RepID=A0A448PEX3_9ACTO|nr:hypothetical protein [Trueperella bialowiezensis]VEI13492.1 Uncharacterised protein [Trueperella bialowiezensis]